MAPHAATLMALLVACRPESKVTPIDDQPTGQTDPGAADDAEEQGDPGPSRAVAQGAVAVGLSLNPRDVRTPGQDDPDDYVYEQDEVEALLSVADVEQGIEDGLATAMWIDPSIVLDEYGRLISAAEADMVSGEGDCPYYYDYYLEYYSYFYWYDSCTTPDGTAFSGYALGYDFSGASSPPYAYPHYAYLSGSGAVQSPDGYTLEIGGSAYDYEYDYYGSYYNYHSGYVVGSFAYDDPRFADTWLAAGLSIDLTISGDDYGDYDVPMNTLTFTGSLSGMTGDVNTVVFTDTTISAAGRGSACDVEPSGTISVRDADGEWYDVNFQGPPYVGASVFPPDCDGCGQVYFRGQYLGDACPDFRVITTWEGRPW